MSDKLLSIEKNGFSGIVEIDFNLPRKEVVNKIIQCKNDKKIAIAKNYQDKKWIKKFSERYDYSVSDCGLFIINNYNSYIKLSTQHVDGYHSFHLYHGESKRMVKIYAHRVVAMAFIPKVENKPEVDHIDRNRSNNDVSNLRWADRIEQLKNREINL